MNCLLRIVIMVLALMAFVRSGHSRVYATPPSATCATVVQYYHSLGGIAGAQAYARQHNIQVTAIQRRQIGRCLVQAGLH